MPALGHKVLCDLKKFTGEHPDVHISGGVALIHGKYPVYQAAKDSDDALEQAKGMDRKNAFSLFGQVWKWDKFDEVIKKFDQVRKIVDKGGPQALMQVLRQLAVDEAKMTKEYGRPVYGPWIWRGVYLLRRMEEQEEKKDPDISDNLKTIRTSLDTNYFGDIDQWGAAARWVQLQLRDTSNVEFN